MRRMMLIVLATAVVSAAIATGMTFLLADDDDVAISSPLPTQADATPEVTGSPEATTSGSDAAALLSPTPASTGGGAASATPRSVRAASSVSCDGEPAFCSSVHSTVVQNDTYPGAISNGDDRSYSGVPTITMRSEVREPDKSVAEKGDKVEVVHAEVVVENKTGHTFVFARREIVLEIRRNGALVDTLKTTGEGFEMTPDGRMTGTFDRQITTDGTYTWQAKTWYYKKGS